MKRILILALVLVGLTSCNNQNQVVSGVVVEYKGIKIEWNGEGYNEVGKDQDGAIRVKINPKYFRPCEVEFLLGDSRKARERLGWTFEYDTLEKLIEEMFSG